MLKKVVQYFFGVHFWKIRKIVTCPTIIFECSRSKKAFSVYTSSTKIAVFTKVFELWTWNLKWLILMLYQMTLQNFVIQISQNVMDMFCTLHLRISISICSCTNFTELKSISLYSTWKEPSIDMLDLIYHVFIIVLIAFLKSSKIT